MPLPSSGQLSIQDIGTEFLSAAPYSLSQFYRGGGKVANSPQNVNVPASGQVAFSNFFGAQLRSVVALAIAANTNNYDVKTAVGSAYFAGYTDVTVTIGSGITVGSASIASPAMTVTGFASGDTVNIVNNGTISGAGATGGRGAMSASSPTNATAGGTGGPGLSISFETTVTNNGTIASGGGGGGGGSGRSFASGKTTAYQDGGGGGGGAGTIVGAGGIGGVTSPNGNTGAAGTATTGGAGGAAISSAGAGGAGGARGAAGAAGTTGSTTVRGTAAGGGAAGNYIVGNANVTWAVTGTRLGNVA